MSTNTFGRPRAAEDEDGFESPFASPEASAAGERARSDPDLGEAESESMAWEDEPGAPEEANGPTREEEDEYVWHESGGAEFEEEQAGSAESNDEASIAPFSIEGELETWGASLARLPALVRNALSQGYAAVAVRMLVGAGERDEGRLTDLVFYSRHPELSGRPLRADERELVREWVTVRDEIVRPLLLGAQSPIAAGARPPSPPAGASLAQTRSGAMRRAWAADLCAERSMVDVRILGRRTPVNPRTVRAWEALSTALSATGYRAERAWVYNCRSIAGTSTRSMHAYGLAVDIDAPWNPNRKTPDKRLVRFSPSATQEGRIEDVRARVADTTFTPEQIAAVEAITTSDGLQVFGWGGRWRTIKDTMHFEIRVTPQELARGIKA